ncbi:folate-binding protein YgfZ [Natrinema gari JCM 14663]|uniref:Folate-binding protein YgfZ n=1 Tax=Natrinema gari JCM 14663 TaxID=1230459 RepID=L9Z390_9EURY|nr:folate-binding protein YgfZ [Natrinema gari JCM 14663]
MICAAADAAAVHDTLLNQGLNAAPFGYRTVDSLALEAGSPLFHTELEGTLPNVLGLRNTLDFEKGCYVGQEVVSRVENRGQPSRRLVGLTLDGEAVPESGAAVFDGDALVGTVTRAGESPLLGDVIALAIVDYDLESDELTVRVDGTEVTATRTELPFVEGSDRSDRLPTYQ